MINTRTTISLGRKGLFPLATLRSFSITEEVRRSSRQELETETDCTGHGALLTGLLFTLLSYTTQDHMLGVAPPTVGWTLPNQSLVKKISYRLAYRQSDGGIFSVKVPFSQMTLACVR